MLTQSPEFSLEFGRPGLGGFACGAFSLASGPLSLDLAQQHILTLPLPEIHNPRQVRDRIAASRPDSDQDGGLVFLGPLLEPSIGLGDLGVLDTGLYQDPTSNWGYAASPTIHGDRVFVQVDRHSDSFIAAYRLEDGTEIWRTPRSEKNTWSTPVVYEHDGREILVANGGNYIRAYDPASGDEVWRFADDAQVKVPTPISAAGKIILLGEHAAVYGKHVLALPIPEAVTATVKKVAQGLTLEVPDWQLSLEISPEAGGVDAAVYRIVEKLGIQREGFAIRVRSTLPRAMGLGSSAAFAVAIVRAFDRLFGLSLDDAQVNEIAFACEKLAHGTPSGVDNTLATYGRPMLFRGGERGRIQNLELEETPPIVVACGHHAGITHEQVAGVRARYEHQRAPYAAIFDQIDALSISGAKALAAGDYAGLGQLMNVCHGLLNAIGVSTPELEQMVDIARKAGAAGAKLTGAGGGGSIVAVCPGTVSEVVAALRMAGYTTIDLSGDRDAKWTT